MIVDSRGTLAEQIKRRVPPVAPLAAAGDRRSAPADEPSARPRLALDLILTNGPGGFTRDGREYVITLASGQSTPAPWANVIANPQFGTVVSESGSAYTWSENAHEFRLTPWHNDPVSDESGEAFYLRDEETGTFWSPTPGPVAGAAALRHPARLRLQRVRARSSGHSIGTDRARRHRRGGQVLGAEGPQRIG